MDYERKVTEYLTPSEILAQMAEEGAELVQAALKLRRAIDKKNPTPKSVGECSDNLTEEFADVLVCLTVFAEAFDVDFDSLIDEIGDIGEAKMKRWAERLEEANKKRYLVNLGADGFQKKPCWLWMLSTWMTLPTVQSGSITSTTPLFPWKRFSLRLKRLTKRKDGKK